MMGTTEPSSVRQQFILPASLARSLEEQAERHGVTKSEFVRRAIKAYDPELEGIDEADLAALLRQLQAAVRESADRVDATLSRIECWPAEREVDQARIREETRRWAEEHPEEVEALAVLFRGG